MGRGAILISSAGPGKPRALMQISGMAGGGRDTAPQHMKVSSIAVLGLVLAAALRPAPACAEGELVVKIGHAAPTSGWLAAVGIENENAARLAIETLNQRGLRVDGRRIVFELITADDAGDAARGRDNAQALVAGGAVAVVGHFLSGTTMAAAPVYAAAGIAQVSPTSTLGAYTRSGWPTAFRLPADDLRIGALLARYAVEQLHARRYVLMDDRGAWGHGLALDFAQAVQQAGGEVVGAFQIDESTADLRPVLDAVKALSPDAVFFGGYDRQAGLVLKQMRRLGIDAQLIGGDGVCSPDLVSFWAEGAARDDQVLCALPAGIQGQSSPALDRFVADYSRRFGIRPQYYGAYVYDAVMLIGDALERATSAAPADLLRALAQTDGYPGLTGPIRFDAKHDVVEPAVGLFTYRDEQRTLLRTLR